MSMILIIEDDEELLAGLASALTSAGFETVRATDGEMALAAIPLLKPDLVLCDINIPKISGQTLLLTVRQEHPDLARMPFIFLTAMTGKQDILCGHEMGVDDYLTKPIDVEILLAIINKRLEVSLRWAMIYESELERERANFLSELSEQTRLSFLSAAEVLHHLAEGVLLLSQACEVVFVNHFARRILAQEDGLAISEKLLVCANNSETLKLNQFLAEALSQTTSVSLTPLLLPRPSGRRPYALRLCRLEAGLALNPNLGPGIALFLSDPEPMARPPESDLMAHYGFTATEARIAADLAVGLSVADIAKSQRISRNTVHHHLKSLFRKLRVTRQSELVSRILSELGSRAPIQPTHKLRIDHSC